jgi:CRP-like cAMP-binding protein
MKEGAVLVRQGAAARFFYVVMRGRLKAGQVTAEGREVAVRFMGPGQMVGGPALFGGAAYPVTASAVERTVVLCWSAAAISSLVSRHPVLARNVMRAMANRIVELQDRCRELATEPVEQRVARAVLRLAEQAGKAVDGGILLEVRLSRQDLAEMTGTTLFTVSRLLSRWSREGLVMAGRQRLVLRRLAVLREIAGAHMRAMVE